MEPCGIGKAVFLAPLRFIRWIWAPIKQAIKAGKLTIGVAEFAAFCTGSWGLSALEAYLWNCSEPFHEISLADNEITVEAGYVHLDFCHDLYSSILFLLMLTTLHILWDDQANAGDDNAGSFEFHELTWLNSVSRAVCTAWNCSVCQVVSSLLRCLYNHPSYPRKSSSDSTVLLHPLVLCLSLGAKGWWLYDFILFWLLVLNFDILDHIFDFMRC